MTPIRPNERIAADAHVVAAQPIDGAEEFTLIHGSPIIPQIGNESGSIEERWEDFLIFGERGFVGHCYASPKFEGRFFEDERNMRGSAPGEGVPFHLHRNVRVTD